MIKNDKDVVYVSFSRRMYAAIIDVFLLSIYMIPVNMLIHLARGENASSRVLAHFLETQDKEGIQRYLTEHMNEIILYEYVPQIVAVFVVMMVFWFFRSATPGKIILGFKIVDAKTGYRPKFAQLVIRFLAYFISAISVVGLLLPEFNKKWRCLHDYIADTTVVKCELVKSMGIVERLRSAFSLKEPRSRG